MQIGMIPGPGPNGRPIMVSCSLQKKKNGHNCRLWFYEPQRGFGIAAQRAKGSTARHVSLDDFRGRKKDKVKKTSRYRPRRYVWLTGFRLSWSDATLHDLAPKLESGDIIQMRMVATPMTSMIFAAPRKLSAKGRIHFMLMSAPRRAGVWGTERGDCQDDRRRNTTRVAILESYFQKRWLPGRGKARVLRGAVRRQAAPAEEGYLHCGPSGAGTIFVKRCTNGYRNMG